MPPGRPQKMQAHFPHQILPFRSEPEPAKYWLHFQTPPRIQVRADHRWQSCQASQHKTKRCTDGKKRCHLSALKPDRQSQYRKEQLQNPVKHIQFSPGKCLRDQIGSKSAVPSVPRQKKEHRQWDRHKADSLVWIFQYVSHKLFYFCKSTANSRPVRPNKIPKRIRYVTVFVSVNDRVCERRTENFSSPSTCEVADAVKDAIAAGSNAEYAILPLTTTSIAKKTAANGV